MQFLIIMVLMLGVMYVLMIRPQRQRQAQQQSMINDASVGDDVLTTGGIYGTIPNAEEDDVVDAELDEADLSDDTDEGVVTDGEEAVRSAVSEAPPGDDRR